MTQILNSFSEISAQYDAAYVDLWGCVHNGLTAFPEAVEALRAYRAGGGTVVLLTNSPRPRLGVEAQLEDLNVPRDCWDTIATSGDSARAAMFQGVVGTKVWFIGEDKDQSFFSPLHLIDNPVEITQVPLTEAEGIVCCGPFDPNEPPETYRGQFLLAREKGLKLLCANPDIVVDRGKTREYCAGALAALYEEMGGTSLYFGKPHPPIYDLARRRLAEVLPNVKTPRVIAIGDGINTDIKGALGEDIDTLFISGGLAREDTKTERQPEPDALNAFFNAHMLSPLYAMGYLR